MVAIQPFLTAYDPSDLPGTSIDPLGFERGYLLLAEKILPGLTNVANRPRYFSALCAAIRISDELAGDTSSENPRQRSQRRLEAIQRLERFWTLACVLASRNDPELATNGIRGLRYIETTLRRMDERGETSTDASFRLLSRQVPYGMVGIYGSVADGLHLIARDTLTLGPDLGRRLADAFISETEMPGSLRKAVADGGSVGLSFLAKWGARAHLDLPPAATEGRVLMEALEADDTRRRMCVLLHDNPLREGESELHRLHRIAQALASNDDHQDLREALRAIVAYEDVYRLSVLAFFRLLWFCQATEPFSIELTAAASDPVINQVHASVQSAWQRLDGALAEANTFTFKEGLDRLTDVCTFAREATAAANARALVERVLLRHREVQRAKLDGGRPKMPWIEIRDGKVVPTLSSAQRLGGAPETVDAVVAHPYRTIAADRFVQPRGEA